MELYTETLPVEYLDEGDKALVRWIGEVYPPILIKACYDDCFSYAIVLKNGTAIYFVGATASNQEWALLKQPVVFESFHDLIKSPDVCSDPPTKKFLERGLVVRISDIAYAIDAPFGS